MISCDYLMLLFVAVERKLFIPVWLLGMPAKSNCMYTDTHLISTFLVYISHYVKQCGHRTLCLYPLIAFL